MIVRAATLPGLFPDGVVVHAVSVEPSDEAPAAAAQRLGVALPDGVRRAVPKRQVEFIAGRVCAAEALRRLTGRAEVVGIGPQREPLWPSDVVGSITHAAGRAAAAVARASEAAGIGLDIEGLLAPENAASLAPTFARPGEVEAIGATGLEVALAATLVFSAKEALFKCLYPRVGRYFDFQDAELTEIGTDFALVCTLRKDLTPDLASGRRIGGRFALLEQAVVVGMILPPA